MIPQAVTIILHIVGGYLLADATDRLGHESAGVPLATVVGVLKESSDLNFNVPDAIAWPVGAYLYKVGKDNKWCWKMPHMVEEYPHIYTDTQCRL